LNIHTLKTEKISKRKIKFIRNKNIPLTNPQLNQKFNPGKLISFSSPNFALALSFAHFKQWQLLQVIHISFKTVSEIFHFSNDSHENYAGVLVTYIFLVEIR